MSYLLDTNVLSELRKGPRADRGLQAWLSTVEEDDLYLSVLVLGELRRGIERVRHRDVVGARSLDAWQRQLRRRHADRILPVGREVAEAWGRLGVPDPIPVVDGLLAATALVHGLTVVTRNDGDFRPTGVPLLNPFDA